MITNHCLRLPHRSTKPRHNGLTLVIDNGVPVSSFEDAIASAVDSIDLVKFGWGTALATPRLDEKMACLDALGIDYFFGGTLFERYVVEDLVDEYFDLCHRQGCHYIEVSNGTISLSNADKALLVARAAEEFVVLSEVGYKDPGRSANLSGKQWSDFVVEDLNAGATFVVTEARESGRSGICDANGKLRCDIVEDIINSGVTEDRLIFEAPTKELQSFFVTRFGSDVNLANVAPTDVIGLETLRLGLRSDTLLHFDLERRHMQEAEVDA